MAIACASGETARGAGVTLRPDAYLHAEGHWVRIAAHGRLEAVTVPKMEIVSERRRGGRSASRGEVDANIPSIQCFERLTPAVPDPSRRSCILQRNTYNGRIRVMDSTWRKCFLSH